MKDDLRYTTGPFAIASDMENVLATITDLSKGIAFIAETMSPDVGCVIQRMAWLITEQCKVAETMREEVFHLTHPNQERATQ